MLRVVALSSIMMAVLAVQRVPAAEPVRRIAI